MFWNITCYQHHCLKNQVCCLWTIINSHIITFQDITVLHHKQQHVIRCHKHLIHLAQAFIHCDIHIVHKGFYVRSNQPILFAHSEVCWGTYDHFFVVTMTEKHFCKLKSIFPAPFPFSWIKFCQKHCQSSWRCPDDDSRQQSADNVQHVLEPQKFRVKKESKLFISCTLLWRWIWIQRIYTGKANIVFCSAHKRHVLYHDIFQISIETKHIGCCNIYVTVYCYCLDAVS